MTERIEAILFGHRSLVLAGFALVTVVFAVLATQVRVDAGYEKSLPREHPFIKTYLQHKDDFGGANRLLVAVMVDSGDIFTPTYFERLRSVTDEVFFTPGIDRPQVRSLFTPNVRFTEVVEGGLVAGNVIPDSFAATPEDLEQVRRNILKAGIVGRLVANDFSGTIVSAQLREFDPASGERLDYAAVANHVESRIRARLCPLDSADGIHCRVIGFAKVVGDITSGATRVMAFFAVALVISIGLVYLYTRHFALTLVPVCCSLLAVVWQLGCLPLLGFGLDPMNILVPFLVYAIGVSHGVQMVCAVRSEIFDGVDAETAARQSFRRLAGPGCVALASDAVGFLTILLIRIESLQEMAMTASCGVAAIILTNLLIMPLLLARLHLGDSYRVRLMARAERLQPIWARFSAVATPRVSAVLLTLAVVIAIPAWQLGSRIPVGDVKSGVPELRPDSRYNLDNAVITERFSIGVDLINVIVEAPTQSCVNATRMQALDDFAWRIENTPGVQSVITLPYVVRQLNAGWNEGRLSWRVVPGTSQTLAQSVAHIPTSSGLLNSDCSVLPVMVFLDDHRSGTIDRVTGITASIRDEYADLDLDVRLATGNAGVIAAVNDIVRKAQYPILFSVFSAVAVLCLASFRSLRALVCILLPLGWVSLVGYSLMTLLNIGLKVNTLPVIALGVGIGVDYGIYIFSRLRSELRSGLALRAAYNKSLDIAGAGVLFTGLTLALGTATWVFSPLQFQADMGILLTFMFLVNMLAAVLLLPSLAVWLFQPDRVSDA